MSIKYLYNDQTYYNEQSLREAIFNNERVAYGRCDTQDDFDNLNLNHKVTIVYYNPDDLLTDEQIGDRVRGTRDRLLGNTDYLMTSDYPISDQNRSKVKAYRQALRDIPQQDGFPRNVTWPIADWEI